MSKNQVSHLLMSYIAQGVTVGLGNEDAESNRNEIFQDICMLLGASPSPGNN